MFEVWDMPSILFWIGVISTVLFIVKMGLFMLVGGDIELDADFTSLSEVDTAFNFFSIQSLLAFFMGYGWCGYIAIKNFSLDPLWITAIAAISGFLLMYFSAYIMFALKKLEQNTTVNYKELEGKAGKSYTAFEPNGNGQIEIILNDKLTILDAISLSDEKIDSFSIIKVEKVDAEKIYIIKV